MEKVYEAHCHFLFEIPLETQIQTLKEEFEQTGTEKVAFLGIPLEYRIDGTQRLLHTQNLKAMALKKVFNPNGYAFAGLVHPESYEDIEAVKEDFLNQVKGFMSDGYDGIKMLEGYPTFYKFTGIGVDHEVYDKFYAYCEENGVHITMHIANPDKNWDYENASERLIAEGRVYDKSYPPKQFYIDQVFNVMKKFPKLRLALAHCGFFSLHYDDAVKFMEYPNTALDITPGGEQLTTMANNWELWGPFWKKYIDKIFYGTDYYAFPKDENWELCFKRRPILVRQMLETDLDHEYFGVVFKGVKLPKRMRDKVYRKNFMRMFGKPKPISSDAFQKEIDRLRKIPDLKPLDLEDIDYIEKNIK